MATSIWSSPATPSSHRSFTAFAHTPSLSSPLASSGDSSPPASPISTIQERRRAQYKSTVHSSPTTERIRSSSRRHSTGGTSLFAQTSREPTSTEEPPRKAFLRERFKARCVERALKDREQKIKGKRRASDMSSDGPDEAMEWEDDEEEEEEFMLNDSFYQRIMSSVQHQRQHSYRVSYQQDVGSSFDPDMEDVSEWEHDLNDAAIEVTPDDLNEEELAEYAAEQELLDGLTADDIFTYSDLDDYSNFTQEVESHSKDKRRNPTLPDDDVDMDF